MSTSFNISHNSDEIVSLLGNDAERSGREDDLTASGLFIGESVSAIYGYVLTHLAAGPTIILQVTIPQLQDSRHQRGWQDNGLTTVLSSQGRPLLSPSA